MTAVEIARARLARATARRATSKRRTATASPRHDDSVAQLALEDALESVLARSMTATPNDALPDDLGALRAPELGDDVFELRVEAFQDRNALSELLALGTLSQDQRAQGADIIRQSVGSRCHGASKHRFRSVFQRRLGT